MSRITLGLIAIPALLLGMGVFVLPTQAAESRTVSGNVINADGGSIYFYSSCQDYYDDNNAAWSDFTGNSYSMTVPDGTYRVLIQPDNEPTAVRSWHNAKPGCQQADVVTISSDTVINLVAATGSRVSGSVQAPDGTVSRGALAWYTSCEEHYAQPQWPAIFSGGTYSDFLPNGTYRVLFYNEVTEYPTSFAYKSWHAAKPSCSQAQQVTVSGDTTVNISVAAGKTVSGTVRTTNAPVASGAVYFFPSCQHVAVRDYVGFSTITDGAYESTLVPGTYRVYIEPTSTGALKSWHNAKPSCDTSSAVNVSANTGLNLVALATSSPSPTPTPSPEPTAREKQTVKKPPKRVQKGQATKLAKKTRQGSRITWKSRTKAVCTVKKTTLKPKNRGVCKVKAKAASLPGYYAYSKVFKIRVK